MIVWIRMPREAQSFKIDMIISMLRPSREISVRTSRSSGFIRRRILPTYASLGLGLQYAGIHLDVTFLTASKTLGNTLLFGLGYAF